MLPGCRRFTDAARGQAVTRRSGPRLRFGKGRSSQSLPPTLGCPPRQPVRDAPPSLPPSDAAPPHPTHTHIHTPPTSAPAHQGDGEHYLGFVNKEADEASKRSVRYRGAKDGKPDTRVTAFFRALVGPAAPPLPDTWAARGRRLLPALCRRCLCLRAFAKRSRGAGKRQRVRGASLLPPHRRAAEPRRCRLPSPPPPSWSAWPRRRRQRAGSDTWPLARRST